MNAGNIFPIESSEPGVSQNVSRIVLAEPEIGRANQALDKVNHIIRELHLGGKYQIVSKILDLVVDLLVGIGGEGGIPHKHFIEDNSNRPPVYRL